MARHRRRAIFTFAESVFRFRYAFAELLSANVAKERSDAEQPGEAVSHEGERQPRLRRGSQGQCPRGCRAGPAGVEGLAPARLLERLTCQTF